MSEAVIRALPEDSAGRALERIVRYLTGAGVDSPRLDARLLLAAVTGEGQAALIARPERVLSQEEQATLADLVARRVAREPLAQILGRREFWSLEFAVSGDVLTPRPDSETLVEAVCRTFPDRQQPLRVVDMGTGSGCLLLSVLSEYPRASGVGVDRSAAAVRLAASNAGRLGLGGRAQMILGDWDAGRVDGLAGRFDAILANPPYIPSADIGTLEPEVARFEPRGALDGGPDGLDAYRSLSRVIPGLLAPAGAAFIEFGIGQSEPVTALGRAAGLNPAEICADLGGIARVAVLRR